jgi:hypothetical protein
LRCNHRRHETALGRVPLDTTGRPFEVTYAPNSTVYSGIGLENDSRVPITIEGVTVDPGPDASGYRLTGIQNSILGQPARHWASLPTTIPSHGRATFVVVFTAEARCDLFPTPAQIAGGARGGSVYGWAEIRFSILGAIPRTQVVRLGDPFEVPQPTRDVCAAG